MTATDDDNAFKKILTTDPETLPRGTHRQQSWFQSVGFSSPQSDEDQLITCPTCRGSGIKEYSSELVALIPFTDERLKPRQTKSKIFCALLICGLIIGTLTFIFYPGPVSVISKNAEIFNASIHVIDWKKPNFNTGKSYIYWKVNITIHNKNRVLKIFVDRLDVFFRIDAWEHAMVGNETYGNITVGANSELTRTFFLKTPNHDRKTANYSEAVLNCRCCQQYGGLHEVFILSSATLHYSLRIVGFDYFSSFISSQETLFEGNCNYFDNIETKDIACETYNSCVSHLNNKQLSLYQHYHNRR